MKVSLGPTWAIIKDFLSNVTVEPCCFLFLTSEMVAGLVREDLYIQKVCKVDFDISLEICDNLTQHDVEQDQVIDL